MNVVQQDGWSMARKKVVRVYGDVREHPRYSVNEAADYLGVSPTTLHRWIFEPADGKAAFIKLADEKRGLLSFYNLVEAYVLVSVRRRGVTMRRMRVGVEYVQNHVGGPHPLATFEFATSHRDMFVQKIEGQTVNASRYGQPVLGDILKKYLKGIKRAKMDKMPIEIRPLNKGTLVPSPVVINPYVSSGSPVIRGTGIIASTVWKRAKGGESLPELAEDYDLKLSAIQTVVDYFDAAA